MTAAYQAAVEWAQAELPGEFAPFAASAAMSLQHLSEPVTADAVLDRLRRQGRDRASLERAKA